eukprot:SAG11_NODE_2052_length_3879_cov_2.030159_5_plen_102_part_00
MGLWKALLARCCGLPATAGATLRLAPTQPHAHALLGDVLRGEPPPTPARFRPHKDVAMEQSSTLALKDSADYYEDRAVCAERGFIECVGSPAFPPRALAVT